MKNANWIGCATTEDFEFARAQGFEDKIVPVKYGIDPTLLTVENRLSIDKQGKRIKSKEIKEKFSITKPIVFVSCGGWAPHKGFEEVVRAFCEIDRDDIQLILTGYDGTHGIPDFHSYGKEHGKDIQIYMLDDPSHVYELMSVADLYIWNSVAGSEGYGLVLLEAMWGGCNWIGTDMVAAHDLAEEGHGKIFSSYDKMKRLMENFHYDIEQAKVNYEYVTQNHAPLSVTKDMLEGIGL